MDPQTQAAVQQGADLIGVGVELAWPIISGVALAFLILVAGWLASKWARSLALKVSRKAKLDESLARFFAAIIQYGVLAVGVIAALDRVGVETTSLVAVMASAGLAVGLALQGSLSNFASGVMILFFRPFELGDVVTVAGHTGKVEDIGIFTTTLIPPDNQKIIVPNSAVTGGVIVNVTTRGTRRGAVDVGVAYGADLKQVQAVLLAAASSVDVVLDDPAPAVAFVEMAASSLNFKVFTWAPSADYLAMLHDVRTACYDALEEAGIEIPFDQVVVHQAE